MGDMGDYTQDLYRLRQEQAIAKLKSERDELLAVTRLWLDEFGPPISAGRDAFECQHCGHRWEVSGREAHEFPCAVVATRTLIARIEGK